jgi:hypothetical protein
MKTMTVYPDQSKSYFFAGHAIEDLGFRSIGKVIYTRQFNTVRTEVFEKDGELYYYKGMSHFNTTIYEAYLGLVSSLTGDYEIIENDEL